MTSRYAKCWLHHGIYGTERKVKDKSQAHCSARESLMTQSSWKPRSFRETRCDVCTEARSKCKATSCDSFVSRDRSFRETWCDVFMSRCLQICWTGKCWEITSWWKQGSFAWIKQDLNELMRQEHQGASSWQLYRRTSATSLCSKIGIGGRPSRIYWVSTRASKTTRRMNYNGKSSSKNSDKKYPWDGKKEESSRITSWRILSTKIERRSWNKYRSSLHKYDKWKSKRILNYSGEFQEVESNYSGGLSYVSSQQAVSLDTCSTSRTTGKRFW